MPVTTDMCIRVVCITQQELWNQWLMNIWFPHLPLCSSFPVMWHGPISSDKSVKRNQVLRLLQG